MQAVTEDELSWRSWIGCGRITNCSRNDVDCTIECECDTKANALTGAGDKFGCHGIFVLGGRGIKAFPNIIFLL
ncbi:hypothetical protein BH10BAC3_BH10BAC3_43190 [soil metagenome]